MRSFISAFLIGLFLAATPITATPLDDAIKLSKEATQYFSAIKVVYRCGSDKKFNNREYENIAQEKYDVLKDLMFSGKMSKSQSQHWYRYFLSIARRSSGGAYFKFDTNGEGLVVSVNTPETCAKVVDNFPPFPKFKTDSIPGQGVSLKGGVQTVAHKSTERDKIGQLGMPEHADGVDFSSLSQVDKDIYRQASMVISGFVYCANTQYGDPYAKKKMYNAGIPFYHKLREHFIRRDIFSEGSKYYTKHFRIAHDTGSIIVTYKGESTVHSLNSPEICRELPNLFPRLPEVPNHGTTTD